LIGIDCGTVRKPLKGFTESERGKLLAALNQTTFFQHNKIPATVTQHHGR